MQASTVADALSIATMASAVPISATCPCLLPNGLRCCDLVIRRERPAPSRQGQGVGGAAGAGFSRDPRGVAVARQRCCGGSGRHDSVLRPGVVQMSGCSWSFLMLTLVLTVGHVATFLGVRADSTQVRSGQVITCDRTTSESN